MVLVSINNLKPINILSLICVLISNLLGIIAGGLGLYYSISNDR